MTPYLIHRDEIREALDQDYWPIEWLDAQVLNGTFRVFGNDRACLIVGVRVYPSGLADVEAMFAAGDAAEIVGSLRAQAEEWGREIGCRGALVESRVGWVRALKQHGYEPHQMRLRKGL